MNSAEYLKQSPHFHWLRVLAIILIILGVSFRCVNIDKKIYWADEAFTSLRISGYTLKEVSQSVYSGKTITVQEFQRYQRLNPEKNLSHTISGLATEEPQLTPLYFALVQLWSQGFGNTIVAVRSLSVAFSLLALLAMYWLGLELFKSSLIALMGTALVAVSPFHIVYAQEARPYSLLTLVILLSSAWFLRTLRQPSRFNWVVYGVTIAVGLYSHLTFIFAALAHGVYLLMLRFWGIEKQLKNYALALILGLLMAVPWFVMIVLNRAQAQAMTSWSAEKITALNLIGIWIGNVGRLFFDLGITGSLASSSLLKLIVLPIGLVLILCVYALYLLQHHAPPKIWVFVFTQIGVTLLLLWLPDLLLNGRTSTGSRYAIPLLLGLQLAVAYCLTIGLTQLKKPLLWRLWAILIFSFGISSGILYTPTAMWWHKAPKYTQHIPEVAAVLNQSDDPLVISIPAYDSDLMRVESLGYYLKPDIRLKFLNAGDFAKIADWFGRDRNVFVYLPSPLISPIVERFQQQRQVGQPTWQLLPDTDNTLFKLESSSLNR